MTDDSPTGQRTARPGITPNSCGVWQQTPDVNVARQLAAAGFDWLALDLQHGEIDRAALISLGRALGDVGTNFVVRVPGVDRLWIGAALDAGAAGIIAPTVNGVDDAELVVRFACYPPLGERSWGPFGLLWGAAAPAAEEANRATKRVIMIETADALADVDAIAAVDGVDALFVGPFDLALSLGTTVDRLLTDASTDAPLPLIVAAATRHHKTVAAFAGSPDRVPALRDHGIDALAVATDSVLLQLGAEHALRAVSDR